MSDYVKTFEIPVGLRLTQQQHNEAIEAINLALVNDTTVNEYRNGELVGKYDDHPNAQKLLKAHESLACFTISHVKVGIKADGSKHLIGLVE